MEHKYIILFLTIILILIVFYYEYCYKNIVLEKFESGRWDDDIGLQVLRDMLGIFLIVLKTLIPGLSVKELVQVVIYQCSLQIIILGKFKKGQVTDYK